jgi:hypothetical protein
MIDHMSMWRSEGTHAGAAGRNIFAHVNGGPSGVSSMRRPRNKDRNRCERKYFFLNATGDRELCVGGTTDTAVHTQVDYYIGLDIDIFIRFETYCSWAPVLG